MPIILDNPETGPAVTKKEVVGFAVNLPGQLLTITFANITATGEMVGTSSRSCSTHAPDGTPLLTAEEYATVRGALYRLALNAGIVSGAAV